MTHTYQITGMTCNGCESKVKNKLLAVPEIISAQVSKENGIATLHMEKHISLTALQQALGGKESKYYISAAVHNETAEQAKSWLATYKPILLIFGYVAVISIAAAWQHSGLDYMKFMRVFMAGFFLVFSFFKLLDIKGFAESYAMYDIVAKKFNLWGYMYAFIELALGLSYAFNIAPLLTNWITFIIMTVSIIGVFESLFNKKEIQCACLGAVFKLPMSTVTIVEDALMIAMSTTMLFIL